MEFDLGEMLRIAKKKRDFGEDTLTIEELYMHAGFTAVAKRFLLGRTEQQRADRQKGLEIFESPGLRDLRSTATGHLSSCKLCGPS